MSLTKVSYSMINGAPINVLDYGAVGDGVTNDTAAILLAVAAMTSNSKLIFPRGQYVFDNGSSTGISLTGLSNIEIMSEGATLILATNARFLSLNSCTEVKVNGFKLKGTMSNTQRYVGNENQGQLVPYLCTNVDIYENTWEDTAGGVFLQVGNTNVSVHNNNFIRTHAGCQTAGGDNNSIFICNNYFLGHVYQTVDIGSDDQIAVFGTGTDFVITGNIIDKQGPTAYNQAHGILVAYGPDDITNVLVADNLIKNVQSTATAPNASTAIKVAGANTNYASKVIIDSNLISRCNGGIYLESAVIDVAVTNNKISFVSSVTSVNSSGAGIRATGDGFANVTNNIFNGNTIKSCDKYGIYVASQSGVTISGNSINGGNTQGIVIDTSNYTNINGNTVTQNTSDGIKTNSCNDVSIVGNLSSLNGGFGLSCIGTIISGSICGNSIAGNTSGNLSITAAVNNSVSTGNYLV